MDLFNNPMIESAKKSLTPEQIEEYKRIGEYMYNNVDFKNASNIKTAKDEDILAYASEALKSGADPHDLAEGEIELLVKTYGEKWYERFNLEESEVPKPKTKMSIAEEVFQKAEEKAKTLDLSRQQRRAMERKIEKDKKKLLRKK